MLQMADLKNIDAEIKKLDDLKTANLSLLTVEKDINSTLLYSMGARKKYTDALSAAATAQRDLMDKEEKLATTIERTHKLNVKALKDYKDLKSRQKELIVNLRKIGKEKRKDKEATKKNIEELDSLKTSISSTADAIGIYERSLKSAAGEADILKGTAEKMKRTFDSLAKIDNKNIGSFEDLNKLTTQRVRLMRMQIGIQEKSGIISKEESSELKDKLGHVEEMYKMQGDSLKQKVSEDLSPMIDDLMNEASKSINAKRFKKRPEKEMGDALFGAQAKKVADIRGAQANNLKSIFDPKTSISSKVASVKSFRGASDDLKKLNDIMKLTGKSASGAGVMMKMLGVALDSLGSLGWIGLLIKAVVAIASAVNSLDKFLKGFNQTFAKLQGPTVLMKDVGKSMKLFTDSIFDLQRNLKYGIKSEDITGMFQGIAESGMSLQGLLNKVQGGYDGMIDKAAKVSFDFGVSMQEAGSMLGEQMTDLRSSADEAAEGFKILSYDAAIAGIQSQKFYQATYAAAESLSYYGKFLTSASTTLKNFQQQGGMGFKDAQKQAQGMTTLFKDMSLSQRVAFIEMTGGAKAYRKDAEKINEGYKSDLIKHTKARDEKRKYLAEHSKDMNLDSIEKIKQEIKVEEDQISVAQKGFAMASTAAKSNAMNMATYMEMFTDKAGEKVSELFKTAGKAGLNVFSTDTAAMVEYLKGILPISDEFARTMINTVKTTRVGIGAMSEDINNLVKELPSDKKSTFYSDISKIIEAGMDGETMKMNDIQKGLDAYSKDSKVDVSRIQDYLNKFPNAVREMVSVGYDKFVKNMDESTLKEGKLIEQVTGEKDNEQAKRLDDVVKNTRTIEDFIGINKENVQYFLAGNDIQKGIAEAAVATARSTGAILGFVQSIAEKSGAKGARTEESFRKSKDYEELKKLLEKEMVVKSELGVTSPKDTQRRSDLEKMLTEIETKKKDVAGQNLYQQDELIGAAGAKLKKLYDDKSRLDEQVATLQKKANEQTGMEQEKTRALIFSVQQDFKQRTYGIDLTDTKKVEENKDYKSTTGGYALLSKGDVVVNARNMSAGIGGDFGAFAGTAASDMMRSIGPVNGGNQLPPSIPVQINIGSVSGDPEEFLKRISPAIEQAFERMYYDKQKRK
jgi:hypothetical protein